MARHTRISTVCIFVLPVAAYLVFLVSDQMAFAVAAEDDVVKFAEKCGITANISKARVFEDSDGKRWRELDNAKEISPRGSEWLEWANVWGESHSRRVIAIEGQGQDFSDSTFYCFDPAGKLSALQHEFRTAWGWGFYESKEFDNVTNTSLKAYFFDTKNRQPIARPASSDDVKHAMTTKVYSAIKQVPFYNLLTQKKL
jgi:hypothetical protein